MDTGRVIEVGMRGIHLLFEDGLIAEAFEQDGRALRRTVKRRLREIEEVVTHLLELPSVAAGRAFIAGLPRELQHVLVLLYFELLHDRLRRRPTLH